MSELKRFHAHYSREADTFEAEAYACYARLIRWHVPFPDAYLDLAGEPRSRKPDAVHDPAPLEAAMRRDPSDPDLWIAAARAHAFHGNHQRAAQLLDRACRSGFDQRSKAQVLTAHWIKDAINPIGGGQVG